MPNYTYTSNSAQTIPAETGFCVSNNLGDRSGDRLSFQSRENWVYVHGAGSIGQAHTHDLGIYTKGQFQCMAIIVAKFENGLWLGAALAHVSSDKSSKVADILALTDEQSCVAIGGKPGSLTMMEKIRDRCLGVQNVWIYVSGNDSPDFGMNREGYFGETKS